MFGVYSSIFSLREKFYEHNENFIVIVFRKTREFSKVEMHQMGAYRLVIFALLKKIIEKFQIIVEKTEKVACM